MSDATAAKALRSPARLVVVEAPAGCGKTYQGAEYAREVAPKIGVGRILILTHTHAACDVFAARTSGAEGRVEIRTMDSLIGQIASAYHSVLQLPANIAAWARTEKDGYAKVAERAAHLCRASPMIARSLSQRYPIIICDEHQDASADQHAIAMACYDAGALVRIFGDPMQRIYGSRKRAEIEADNQRWKQLKEQADIFDDLDKPHRWSSGTIPLGEWILNARTALCSGGRVDLRGAVPSGVSFIYAENQANNSGGYRLVGDERKPIDKVVEKSKSLLVLATQNATVRALRPFFNRRLPIWEGHLRDNLSELVDAVQKCKGQAVEIAQAVVNFLSQVGTGFSPSAFGNILLDEVSTECVAKRKGKPATLQSLARMVLELPDHKGVAKVLHRISELIDSDAAFGKLKIDYHREFWDAVRIGQFENPDEGLVEIARRWTYSRPSPPRKAISTVHKAKGLECSDVLILQR